MKKIVFTNGCFDMLHEGHKYLLKKSKGFGDVLIVGLNSDASVRRLKGKARPVEDQETRVKKLLNLEFVDKVFIFHENTPINLINSIKPDIIVKGGDYKTEDIIGSKEVLSRGGQVKTVPLVEGISTTKILANSKDNILPE